MRALQVEPRVLLLDEPTASTDAEVTRRVDELLGSWVRGGGSGVRRAYVWSSHDASQLDRVVDRRLDLGAASAGMPEGGRGDETPERGTGAETSRSEATTETTASDATAAGSG